MTCYVIKQVGAHIFMYLYLDLLLAQILESSDLLPEPFFVKFVFYSESFCCVLKVHYRKMDCLGNHIMGFACDTCLFQNFVAYTSGCLLLTTWPS